MSHTLIDAQFVCKRAGQREINILPILLNRYYRSKLLYNSRKHTFSIFNLKEKGTARVM
jgi:hypothetical protein